MIKPTLKDRPILPKLEWRIYGTYKYGYFRVFTIYWLQTLEEAIEELSLKIDTIYEGKDIVFTLVEKIDE